MWKQPLLAVIAVAVAAGLAAFVLAVRHGFSARDEPLAAEAFIAKRLRRLAIPAGAGGQQNPVASTPEVLASARLHFADHCALCHGNDGSGQTEIGRNLYPKAPDMRLAATQGLTDGELFYIIENGIRFTGMPAWGTGAAEGGHGSWELVHFIRHLPALTPAELAEMEAANPVSPLELRAPQVGEPPHRHDHGNHPH